MLELRRRRTIAISFLCFIAWSDSARADGLDLDYFLRFNSWGHSTAYVCTVLVLIMVVNYLLNFAVIGAPAIRLASARPKTVALGLLFLTLLGQLADRIGSILGAIIGVIISSIISGGRGMDNPYTGPSIIVSNLLCSGIAVGCLALWFLRRRWSVPRALSYKIALAAGILTNPAWIMLLPIGRG